MLVQAEVRDQLFQLPVFILKLLQTPQLADAKTAVHLLLTIECLLRNPHPPDNFGHRRTGFRLLQRKGNLLVRVPRLLHVQLLARRLLRAGKLSLKLD